LYLWVSLVFLSGQISRQVFAEFTALHQFFVTYTWLVTSQYAQSCSSSYRRRSKNSNLRELSRSLEENHSSFGRSYWVYSELHL